MVNGLYLPGAVFRPISYRLEAATFKGDPLGWILHVAEMNGSPFDVFNRAKSPNRRFSNGWVAKDGSGEQYQTLDRQSWAQASGNPWYWAFETEGYAGEPLTAAQIATLAKWHKFLGTPDLIANRPGDEGIGTHYMGKSAYGGHSCPDPQEHEGSGPRSLARADIIRVANGRKPSSSSPVPPAVTLPAPPVTPPVAVTPPFPGITRHGSRGAAVVAVQRRFETRGWKIGVDGVYGDKTEAVVKAFQKEKGLKPIDGIVGPITWAAIWKRDY